MNVISIAMATYNGAKYLEKQLESIALQRELPYELVIQDDGSEDGTLSIIKRFAASAAFPVHLYLNESRLGYASNFLSCANKCAGDWIAFCDQDDIWDPDKIEVVRRVASTSGADLLIHDAIVQINDQPLRRLYGRRLLSKLSNGRDPRFVDVFGLTMVFRKSLLRFEQYRQLSAGFNIPCEPEAHDQWIYFLARSLGKIQAVDQSLLAYRQHQFNVAGARRGGIKQRFKQVLESGERVRSISVNLHKRAEILEEILLNSEQDLQLQAETRDALLRFKTAESLNRVRTVIYESEFLQNRVRSFFTMLFGGCYSDRAVLHVGLLGLVSDIVFTLGATEVFKLLSGNLVENRTKE